MRQLSCPRLSLVLSLALACLPALNSAPVCRVTLPIRVAALELGSVQESVTVSASTLPLLQTASADTGAILSSRDVQNLPAFGRDPYQLVRLAPGMIGTGALSNSSGQPATLGNTSSEDTAKS